MSANPDVVTFRTLPNGDQMISAGEIYRQTADAQIQERNERTCDNIRGGPCGTLGYLLGGDNGSDAGAKIDAMLQALKLVRELNAALENANANKVPLLPPGTGNATSPTSQSGDADPVAAADAAREAAMATLRAAEQAQAQETDPTALAARQAEVDKAQSELDAARGQYNVAVINKQTGVTLDDGTPKASGHQEGEKSLEAKLRDKDGTILYVNPKTGAVINPGSAAGKEDDTQRGFVPVWVPSQVPGRNPGVKDVVIQRPDSASRPSARLSAADRTRLQQLATDYLKNNPKK